MKNVFTTFGRRVAGLSTAALLAFAAPVLNSFAQPASPVGAWDCIMTGNGQNGILFLNFTGDSDGPNGVGLPIFEGLYIQAGHKKVGGASGRNGASGTGRTQGSVASVTNLFGGGFLAGSATGIYTNVGPDDWLTDSRGYRGYWFFNNKGQVVGSFYNVLNSTALTTNFFETCTNNTIQIPLTNGGFYSLSFDFCFTNAVLNTNYPWLAPDREAGTTNLLLTNFNYTVGLVGQTNDVSFVGKVVPGKRLTLVGTSAFGKFTIRGVPLNPINTALPLDGFYWTGSKFQNGFHSMEQFGLVDLVPNLTVGFTNLNQVIPNAYIMVGQGPSYSYGSTNGATLCLISSQKRIGFFVQEVPYGTIPNLFETRATFGKFVNTTRKIGGNTLGESTADFDLIQFNAFLSPYPLP